MGWAVGARALGSLQSGAASTGRSWALLGVCPSLKRIRLFPNLNAGHSHDQQQQPRRHMAIPRPAASAVCPPRPLQLPPTIGPLPTPWPPSTQAQHCPTHHHPPLGDPPHALPLMLLPPRRLLPLHMITTSLACSAIPAATLSTPVSTTALACTTQPSTLCDSSTERRARSCLYQHGRTLHRLRLQHPAGLSQHRLHSALNLPRLPHPAILRLSQNRQALHLAHLFAHPHSRLHPGLHRLA